MGKAIIFATFIPNKDLLWVGIEMLDELVNKFSSYDIYVGINNSCVEWINTLDEYKKKLNLKYRETPLNLIVPSDASAFQTALNLYKSDNKKHEVVWFIHTKGVTSKAHKFRHLMYDILFNKRKEIESILEAEDVGLFSPYTYRIQGHKWDNYIENNLKTILDGDRFEKATNISCYYTFYILKGIIVNNFVNDVDTIFFTKKLTDLGNEQNFDIYFFERDFPMISEKYGYKVYPPPIDPNSNSFYWQKKCGYDNVGNKINGDK